MPQHTDIFVVIPCYNEAVVIRQTVEAVLSYGYSVIVVDDASLDNSYAQLAGLSLFYIRHAVNLGQGAALQTGIDFARDKGAQYVVTFDADGQHDAADIERMITVLIEKKADIVFGSRFLPGAETNISSARSLLINAGRYLNYFFSGILLSDAHNGLRVLNQTAVEKIRLKENRMAHATEIQLLAAKWKLKYAECPVNIHYNEYSKQKGQSLWGAVKIVFDIILNKIFS